jgi:hypothetical protein
MTNNQVGGNVDNVRRKLLRTSIVMGGAFAAGQIPYRRPETKSFFGVRSAWAQPTVPYTFDVSFQVSGTGGPGTACQNSIIDDIKVQVVPVPPAGTVLVCTPTTDDPNNLDLPTFSSTTVPTDDDGCVNFAKLDLIGNVPNPPLAIGSILTMTVTFEDQATFGTVSAASNLTIVAAC